MGFPFCFCKESGPLECGGHPVHLLPLCLGRPWPCMSLSGQEPWVSADGSRYLEEKEIETLLKA